MMGYRKISYPMQIWYVIKYAFRSWIEWQDAKEWAKEYHPAWVELAKKARHEEVRKDYKRKILLAYRGYDYV